MDTKDDYFKNDYDRDDAGNEYGLTKDDLAGAITVWTAVQDDTPTITGACKVFNVSPALVLECLEAHPWMVISVEHDAIELEGM